MQPCSFFTTSCCCYERLPSLSFSGIEATSRGKKLQSLKDLDCHVGMLALDNAGCAIIVNCMLASKAAPIRAKTIQPTWSLCCDDNILSKTQHLGLLEIHERGSEADLRYATCLQSIERQRL